MDNFQELYQIIIILREKFKMSDGQGLHNQKLPISSTKIRRIFAKPHMNMIIDKDNTVNDKKSVSLSKKMRTKTKRVMMGLDYLDDQLRTLCGVKKNRETVADDGDEGEDVVIADG